MEDIEYLRRLNRSETVTAGSDMHLKMHQVSQRAMQLTTKLNATYHTPEEVRQLFAELIGKAVDESFNLFPPFYTDCGLNITVGNGVFINSCCNFQDQGGITIGEGSLIGHKAALVTLNHGHAPSDRGSLYPAPIVLGKGVWVGASATILPGITVGDHAIVAAGAVVTRDVPSRAVVAGVPAKVVRML